MASGRAVGKACVPFARFKQVLPDRPLLQDNTAHFPPFPSRHRLLLTDNDRQNPHGLPLPAVDLGPLPPVSWVWVLEVWVGDSLDPIVHHTVPRVVRVGVRVALLWLQSGLLSLNEG